MPEVRRGAKRPHLPTWKAVVCAQKANEKNTKSSNLGAKSTWQVKQTHRRERSCLGETRMLRRKETVVMSSALECFLFSVTLKSVVTDTLK